MGITIVHKSDAGRAPKRGGRALILAGGAVTGGAFKAGGIKALNDYFTDFTVNDFDIYFGISSGSMLAAPLMGGISPESILKSLEGRSSRYSQLRSWHYYLPNFDEFAIKPISFLLSAAGWLPRRIFNIVSRDPKWLGDLFSAAISFLSNPTRSSYEDLISPLSEIMKGRDFPSLLKVLPSGLFDNRPIEKYIRHNIERNGLTNDFDEAYRLTGKRLYITAVALDGARRAVFGPGEETQLTISEAIQASTALPGFYRPAHLCGVNYVDGGVQDTADIDLAVEKGASLIVCYNPFRPIDADSFVDGLKKKQRRGSGLAADGIIAVFNQILRAFFHERLKIAIERFKMDPKFKGDIILIEPRADDAAYFAMNPLFLGNRIEAANLGFQSVRRSIEKRYDEISSIMKLHGIEMTRTKVKVRKSSKKRVKR